MNTKSITNYGKPAIGCYADCHRGFVGCARIAIDLAIGYGMPMDRDNGNLLARFDHDVEREFDHESLDELCDEAENFLNEQEARPFLSWGWYEGDFGLYPDVDMAREDCGFVSGQPDGHDPLDRDYPDADYRGEWLHVSDHGNATLYVRSDAANADGYSDAEVWSVV